MSQKKGNNQIFLFCLYVVCTAGTALVILIFTLFFYTFSGCEKKAVKKVKKPPKTEAQLEAFEEKSALKKGVHY